MLQTLNIHVIVVIVVIVVVVPHDNDATALLHEDAVL